MTSILTVCTGNICRSPAAEVLFRRHLGDLATVSSAGTQAMVGSGIPAEMLMSLDAAGVEGREHRAQQLTDQLARDATVVIAMAAEHRRAIVQQTPSALRRTFLLDELAHAARAGAPLEGETAVARLENVPAAIAAFRPELAGMGIQDVPDPYRRSQERYDESYAMIEAAVRDIAAWIKG